MECAVQSAGPRQSLRSTLRTAVQEQLPPCAGHLDRAARPGAVHTICYDGHLAAECRRTGDAVEPVRSLTAFLLQRSGA